MLDKLHRVALAMVPLQGVCFVAIGVLCAMVALSIFDVSVFAGDAYLIPAFVALLWLLCLYGFIVCFRSLPAAGDSDAGSLARLKSSLVRAGYWLIALLLLFASIAAALVTVRFLRIWYE